MNTKGIKGRELYYESFLFMKILCGFYYFYNQLSGLNPTHTALFSYSSQFEKRLLRLLRHLNDTTWFWYLQLLFTIHCLCQSCIDNIWMLRNSGGGTLVKFPPNYTGGPGNYRKCHLGAVKNPVSPPIEIHLGSFLISPAATSDP